MLNAMQVVLLLLNGRSLNVKSVAYKRKRRRRWLKSYGFANNSDSFVPMLKTCCAKV